MAVIYNEHLKLITKMIVKGHTSYEIVDKLNGNIDGFRHFLSYHHPKLHKKIIKNNKNKRGVYYVEKALKDKNMNVDELLQQGLSISQVAKRLKVAPQTFDKYLRIIRPDIYESFVSQGKLNKVSANIKITDSDLERMVQLSQSGMGIDSIGKLFNVDGTSVRHRLIQEYGLEEYQRIHSKDRYDDNHGWNGKSIEYNGVKYQSMAEVQVANTLTELGLTFDAHSQVKMKDGKIYYPDFYVKELDLFIEYAGMLNKNFYRVKFAKKVNDYSINNIKFMVVVLETLPNLKENLRRYM